MIHPTSDVQSVNIGANSTIWQYSVILKDAVIGRNCNINCHVFIENDVVIGDNVTVKSGVYIWDGINLEDNVFIGPNVTFVNVKTPRSKVYPEKFQKTIVRKNASLGAACTILGGLEIGEYAMIGAGAVVLKNVPARALIVGNPGKLIGWLNDDGSRMLTDNDLFVDNNGAKWQLINKNLVRL